MADPGADLELFLRALRKAGVAGKVLGSVFVIAAALVFAFANDPDMDPQTNLLIKAGVSGAIGALGLFLVVIAARRPERSRGIVVLCERAADVVWICPTRRIVNGVHSATRFDLYLLDRTKAAVGVDAKDESVAEEVLRRRCPGARFGYDPDWETAYERDPASLRSS